MIADLVVAARALRRSPAFTLAAMATLALGIGANTAMFSVVNGVLLRPLPGYETDRLMRISDNRKGLGGYPPPGIYQRLRERLHSFAPLAANQYCRMNLTGSGEPEQVNGPCATANWFELHRAQAMLGRTFLPDEDQHGRNHVVVLDYGYWQRRFGGDRGIVGTRLLFDQEPWTVVGVMPSGFRPSDAPPFPIYTPYVVADNPHGLNVVGRLKPGVSREAAQAELDAAAVQLARESPDWISLRLRATPVLEQVTGPHRPLLLLLLGAVSFLLLMACVNVANLMLARCTARRHEIEIRIALGASRARILRFVLAEALMISGAACGLAVAIAYGGLRLLKPLTASLPRADELSVDGRVLGWSLGLGVAAALLSGMLPALRSTRDVRSSRSQRILVGSEAALAFVLLMGAGLLIRSFTAMRAVDLGYDPRHVLTTFLALRPSPSPDGGRTAGAETFERIRERVSALPGVQTVATASTLPMFGVSISLDIHPEGEPVRPERVASASVVSESYFRAMGIPLRSGRVFTADDRDGAPLVAIVSESIAARYFGGKTSGRRMVIPELKFNIDGGKDVAAEIVGVVGDVCVNSVEDCHAAFIYLPERQNALRMENLLVRTAGEPMALARAVRHAMYQEAPSIPPDEFRTLEQRTSYLTDGPGRAMWLLGLFAGVALLLAAAGIYGVSAYLAASRRREIAIRMALGATFGDIAGMLYRCILLPSAIGLGVGMAAAMWLARFLRPLLFGVAAGDPKTLVLAACTLLGVAILAAAGPAIRAGLSNPCDLSRILSRE